MGFCRARKNTDGVIKADNYGKVTSVALDPIEKKPLARFYPGSYILSVGSYGCNLRCPFCQNYSISMGTGRDHFTITPDQLTEKALELKPQGNIGVAYTYNEPLIGYEFVLDTAMSVSKVGLKNVAITNGYINQTPLKKLLPYMDAFNIDLKGFSEEVYRFVGGDLETVKNTIKTAAAESHVEVTTLIIPGKNDSPEEMEALASWLADINPDTPLHISRFFPAYKMTTTPATPVHRIYELSDIARRHLKYVYEGNI